MAMEYERYEQSSAAEKNVMVDQARERLENNLHLGPLYADARGLFKDIYLLDKINFFASHPKEAERTMRLASHPKIRGEFVETLKEQDTTGQSKEVLTTLAVGSFFGYGAEMPFQSVFIKLEAKHEQLIAEDEARAEATRRAGAARQAQEAAQRRAEEAKRRAEETARQRSSGTQTEGRGASGSATSWPPESAGKSPEWVVAQLKIKRLWEQKSRNLPHDIGASEEAGKAYFRAGFDLLKDEISNGSLTNTQLRAMIEYLVPRMGKNPGAFKRFLRQMQNGESSSPTNLSNMGFLAKTLFVPALLQGVTLPDKDQTAKIRSIYRQFQKALHPDIANTLPDVNKALSEPVEALGKTVNVSWAPLGRLLK